MTAQGKAWLMILGLVILVIGLSSIGPDFDPAPADEPQEDLSDLVHGYVLWDFTARRCGELAETKKAARAADMARSYLRDITHGPFDPEDIKRAIASETEQWAAGAHGAPRCR